MAVRGLCRRTHAAVKIIAAVPSVRSGRLLGKNRPTRERKGKSREFRRCWSPRSHTVRSRLVKPQESDFGDVLQRTFVYMDL